MMKKRLLKILALSLAILLIVGVCVFANGLVGNPISYVLATNAAQKHIDQNYSGGDLEIERVSFSFKDGYYHAYVISPTSIDTRFSLGIDMLGGVRYDLYENNVLKGWNTAYRIRDDYREAVDAVFDSSSFPFEAHIAYGDIEFVPSEYKDDPSTPPYAIVIDDLVLDAFYDIRELGSEAGKLTIYLYDDEVTVERLAEMMLDIRRVFDEAGVSFYVMDCVLEHPKSEDGSVKEGRVEAMDFLYADIYEDGMTERVGRSN